MANKQNILLPLAAALALVSCGGGGGGGGNDQNTATTTVSGKAVDGYLSGATVFCDANGNGTQDGGEMAVTTDNGGNFRFPSACSSSIVVIGGKDMTTGFLFQGKLKANPGSGVVTPLTALLIGGLTKAQLATALGLQGTPDIANLDPLASGNGELYSRTLAVQQIVQQVANIFGMRADVDELEEVYTHVATALAAVIQANPGRPLFTAGQIDVGLLTAAINAAKTRIDEDATLPDVALTPQEIGTLTNELKKQAEQFLGETDRKSLDSLARNLQNPENGPIIDTEIAARDYIYPANDSIEINGTPEPLSKFTGAGLTVDVLETIGLAYEPSASDPEIDTVVDVAASLESTDPDDKRVLQVKVERVHILRNPATDDVTLSSTANTVVTVYASSSQGSKFVKSFDKTFNPLTIRNKSVVVNYADLVARTVGNPANTSGFDASQFTHIAGTFTVKFVVSPNLNVRRGSSLSSTALPTLNIGIFNTIKGVTGPGIQGTVTIN